MIRFKNDLLNKCKKGRQQKCLMYVNLQVEIFLKSRFVCTKSGHLKGETYQDLITGLFWL